MSGAAVLLASIALAASGPTQGSANVWGGDQSCATWLSNQTERAAGNWWVWGFWSGLNAQVAGNVGHSTDANGIIGEVKLYCDTAPSTTLISATNQVYKRFKAAGR